MKKKILQHPWSNPCAGRSQVGEFCRDFVGIAEIQVANYEGNLDFENIFSFFEPVYLINVKKSISNI